MARKSKSIAEFWRERTGTEYIHTNLRWNWIDYPMFEFAEVLECTALPKGRIESFVRRGLLDLGATRPKGGKGYRRLYSGREILKIWAVDGLVTAGAWTECLIETFGTKREFDLILNSYQFGAYSPVNRPDPIEMNTRAERRFYDTGKSSPYETELELNLARIRGEWPKPDWAFLTFDVGEFIAESMPRLIRFVESKGVALTDR
ncbi:hypothetical protein [uncultured Paludibaculum sp.]|uniref:hypothetical protein n=1 Tax=uncultured Paludibaculum sp. TaxID=1765020 RepID=UPI002AAB6728|nr:hypothetical protein [uncultured Paludibaculum sp.]